LIHNGSDVANRCLVVINNSEGDLITDQIGVIVVGSICYVCICWI